MSVLLVDTGDFVLQLANAFKADRKKLIILCQNMKVTEQLFNKGYSVINASPFAKSSYRQIDFSELSEIIIGAKNIKKAKQILDFLNSRRKASSQLILALKDSVLNPEDEKEIEANKIISIPDLVSKDFFIELGKYNKRRNVEKLFSNIADGDNVLIVSHDNPDPDSIASSMALKYLLKKAKKVNVTIGYGGNVGRSENTNMLELLKIKMFTFDQINLNKINKVAMIETAPDGTTSYRGKIAPCIIIDHHPHRGQYNSAFVDIRPEIGANSTILTEYFIYSRYKMTKQIATALLYAIKTDTMSFNRGITSSDIEAFSYLYNLADLNLLKKIEQPSLSLEEFEAFGKATLKKKVVKGVLFSDIGEVKDREIIPQIADFCLELKGIKIAVVIGTINENLFLSARNKDIKIDAGKLLKKAFEELGSAGGHKLMAAAELKMSKLPKSRKEINSFIIENIIGNL
ncbi:MAG: DHH family phosphoesterase [Candidatus Schekmanbacteria bacterium]|nr:DHH family phosphoesterase [Candidatus Schekmanbacteria bacterium]